MDPSNFDAYGGLAHTEYCFQVSEISVMWCVCVCAGAWYSVGELSVKF